MLEDSQHLFNEVSMLYHRALRLRYVPEAYFKCVMSDQHRIADLLQVMTSRASSPLFAR